MAQGPKNSCPKCGKSRPSTKSSCPRCEAAAINLEQCPACEALRWDPETEWCFACHHAVPSLETIWGDDRRDLAVRACDRPSRHDCCGVYRVPPVGASRKPKGSERIL